MVSSIVPPIPVIDDYIDRFEDAWNDGEPRDLSSFLPIDGDAHRLSVLTEVVRVDLERRWTTDSHRSLDSYLEEFPELRSDADALGQVAYEEYRLRLRGEEAILPDAYARRYGVDISDWPRTTADTHHFASWHESTVNILQQESKRLVEAIEAYPAVGSDFLGFHLREKLGEGKFSRVYLAQQGALADRLVVLKLSTELWSESQRLARLQHTHIVPIYSVHHCGKMQALCMPFLGRQTLADAFRAEDAATPWQPIQRLTQLGVACRPHRCRHKVTGPDDGPTTLADQERACCRFVASPGGWCGACACAWHRAPRPQARQRAHYRRRRANAVGFQSLRRRGGRGSIIVDGWWHASVHGTRTALRGDDWQPAGQSL